MYRGDGGGKASLSALTFVWSANTAGAAAAVSAGSLGVAPSSTVPDGGAFTIGNAAAAAAAQPKTNSSSGHGRRRRAKGHAVHNGRGTEHRAKGKGSKHGSTGMGKVGKVGGAGPSKGKGGRGGRGGGIGVNTAITVNGETTTLHTSCSQPIYTGLTLPYATGTLTLVDFVADGLTAATSCSRRRARRQVAGTTGGCSCGPKSPNFALDNNVFKYCSHFWHSCAVSQWYAHARLAHRPRLPVCVPALGKWQTSLCVHCTCLAAAMPHRPAGPALAGRRLRSTRGQLKAPCLTALHTHHHPRPVAVPTTQVRRVP